MSADRAPSAAQRREERAPKLHHLLSKVGGVWWIAREQAEAELDALLTENDRLREQVNSGRAGREAAEGLPEGTLPRVY